MHSQAQRRELLIKALQEAHPDYAQRVMLAEVQEGEAGANLECAILCAWLKACMNPINDPRWFEQRLKAIAFRGVRGKGDEACLKLQEQGVDLAALARVVTDAQLDVAYGMFGIHSGSYRFELNPNPAPRFTFHCQWSGEPGEARAPRELPNDLDDFFQGYMFGG